MDFNDFAAAIKNIEDQIRSSTGIILSKLDRATYGLLINCLKSEDPIAVKTAIDQLAAERKPLAIPPLYLVSVAHPNQWVRLNAKAGLDKLISSHDLAEITNGKDLKNAVNALIDKYGNFHA